MGCLTTRSTRTLPLRVLVLSGLSGFPVSHHRAAIGSAGYTSLGYFIFPIDAIPDVTPVVGYADDLGTLAAAIATVAVYINDKVKINAANKLRDWFGEY
jgi:uncharacterized membrane protein YkvA (DUF1232 family)